MKRSFFLRGILIPAALVTTGIFFGNVAGRMANADQASPFPGLATFAQALTHLENSHVDPIDQDALIQGAIRGMTEALDPHTTYLDPFQFAQMMSDTQGHFAGIGVEISVRDGWLTVLAVFEGGPADQAGLESGDRFVYIENQAARDMRLSDAIRIMRGEVGTTVNVGIRRDGVENTLNFELTRDVIEVNPVVGHLLSDGILVIRLRAFQGNTTGAFVATLDRAEAELGARGQSLTGIILDLRSNPGGLLQSAVEISDLFLSEGTIVTTRGRGGVLMREESARRRGTRDDTPMVVLINGFSASAAEIVAGALKDHGRATLVGTRTWGKGSVQTLVELDDGGALKMTIARYFTPSGQSIQAVGIEPDVEVHALSAAALRALRIADQQAPREASLEQHLRNSGQETPRERRAQGEDLRERTGDEEASLFDGDQQGTVALGTLRAMIEERVRP